MYFFPFLVLGLLNGMVVGLAAGLAARVIAPDSDSLRFLNAALLGMAGSIAGSVVAAVVIGQGGYLASGPSSLYYSVVGAALAIVGVTFAKLQTRSQPAHRFDSRQN